jgi:phospholipase/carboxylesterase
MSLVHLVREPAAEPEGALILNHGRGSDERDLYGLLDELDPERRLIGVSTGAPLTGIPPGGRHWYVVERVGSPDARTFDHGYRALTGFLEEFLDGRGVAWERTIVGGFSMGAVMSYAVALGEGRPSPAAVIALSGFVPTVDTWRADLSARGRLPVFIHHGRLDPVIGVEFGRRARDLLERAALEVAYLETEAGHWLPPEILPRLRDFVAESLARQGARSPGS